MAARGRGKQTHIILTFVAFSGGGRGERGLDSILLTECSILTSVTSYYLVARGGWGVIIISANAYQGKNAEILRRFVKLRKVTISLVMSVRPSA